MRFGLLKLIQNSEANEISFQVSAYRSLKKKCSVVLVNPESVLGYLQGYLLKQECENTEFVWELKRGFEKAAVSTAVCLQECPLRKPPGHCIKESKL